MHGVGAPFIAAAFEAFGFPAYIPVVEQCGTLQISLDPTIYVFFFQL